MKNKQRYLNLGFLLFLSLILPCAAAKAVVQCTLKTASSLSPSVPNPGTMYVQFNTTLKVGAKYLLSSPTLPTLSYFNITAYLNGVQIGNINDFQIRTSTGSNFYPAPGAKSATNAGSPSGYSVTIGEDVTGTNAIALPHNSDGKQLEIFLRYYPPLSAVVLPTVTEYDSHGLPVDCSPNETAYFTAGNVPYIPPVTSSNEMGFYKTGGAGLYPDTNGYVVGKLNPNSITFVTFPAPKYPPCVNVGCVMDRTGAAAYTSIHLASLRTTQSLEGISDREMKAAADGMVYLAFAPKIFRSALESQGFQVLTAPLGFDLAAVYRQKLPPTDAINNIARIPFLPASPVNPSGCLAANYIPAPVATVCPVTTAGTGSQCVKQARQTLQELVASYASRRYRGIPSTTTCY